MATGPEMFAALKSAMTSRPTENPFRVNSIDAKDLGKLTAAHLVSMGFDEDVADRVSAELLNGGLETLGRHLGRALVIDRDAGPL